MSSPAAPRRQPAAARRTQILDAAQRCFGARGYHASTMDDLVRASGLSKGSLYWHFSSKEEVFLALFDRFAAEILAAWSAGPAEGRGVLDVVRGGAELALERIGAQSELLGAWAEFLSHPRARDRYAAVLSASRAQLAELLRVGVASGELRDLPVEGMAAGLTAAIEGLLLQAMVDPGFDAGRHGEVLWEGLLRGFAR